VTSSALGRIHPRRCRRGPSLADATVTEASTRDPSRIADCAATTRRRRMCLQPSAVRRDPEGTVHAARKELDTRRKLGTSSRLSVLRLCCHGHEPIRHARHDTSQTHGAGLSCIELALDTFLARSVGADHDRSRDPRNASMGCRPNTRSPTRHQARRLAPPPVGLRSDQNALGTARRRLRRASRVAPGSRAPPISRWRTCATMPHSRSREGPQWWVHACGKDENTLSEAENAAETRRCRHQRGVPRRPAVLAA
jgi:hypothetical protein